MRQKVEFGSINRPDPQAFAFHKKGPDCAGPFLFSVLSRLLIAQQELPHWLLPGQLHWLLLPPLGLPPPGQREAAG